MLTWPKIFLMDPNISYTSFCMIGRLSNIKALKKNNKKKKQKQKNVVKNHR